MQTQTKYIRVRHWNYWWGAYQLLEGDEPAAAEFSLTNDIDGETLFFHFDFYNISALQETIAEKEFMEPDHCEYPMFLEKAEALQKGEISYFIGSLYYPSFHPTLEFCNQRETENQTIFDAQRPVAAPEYAVVFLGEKKPLVPEVLKKWVEQLAQPLFGQSFTCEFADVPTKTQAQESYRKEFAYLAFGRDKK